MPELDLALALAGLVVGFTVGLTGMGGGALMTPLLVLVFDVGPLAAVSSDLVASLVMKPIGGGVHLRRGNVHTVMVRWLVLGSVPAALAGVLVLDALQGDGLEEVLRPLLGGALVVAATAMATKGALAARRPGSQGGGGQGGARSVAVRPVPTLAIGVLGGLVVGMTSVGSGSLMIVLLLVLYPRLTAGELVGTDLVQAVPLVGAAALGHLLLGDVRLDITTSLLLGALPAVYLGARLSARAPDRVIRPVLVAVLSASGLELLGVPTAVIPILATVVVASVAFRVVHRRRRAIAPEEPLPR